MVFSETDIFNQFFCAEKFYIFFKKIACILFMLIYNSPHKTEAWQSG